MLEQYRSYKIMFQLVSTPKRDGDDDDDDDEIGARFSQYYFGIWKLIENLMRLLTRTSAFLSMSFRILMHIFDLKE